jgi:hypothetical protein
MGDCPYPDCDGAMFIPIAGRPPAFQRHECETCGRPIWTRHSRIDPWSMTESEFFVKYEIDDVKRTVRERARPA